MRFTGILLALLMLAGCGHGAATLDQALLERQIHDWAVHKEAASPAVKVHCPADVPIKPGATFHCIVTARHQSARLVVTIENDQGEVTWTTG